MIVVWLAALIDAPFVAMITPFGWKALGIAAVGMFVPMLGAEIKRTLPE